MDTPLLVRFRRTLGLTGLAALTMGSGPCGGCLPDETACYESTELIAWQESGLAESGSGGATGDAGTGLNEETKRYYQDLAASWDSADGCPTARQVGAILVLNGENDPYFDRLDSVTAKSCCYKAFGECNGGRPFLVAGAARVASLTVSADASSSNDRLRRALRDSWTEDALMEHASVASFARLSLRLLALGAPSELVEASQRAALDELAHARFCFERASHFAGERVRPGALAVDDALCAESFADFVRTNLVEGCIGETLAAVRMGEQARRAADPELGAALAVVAEDEARHAELAFLILGFCLERDRALTRAAIAELVAVAAAEAQRPLPPATRDDAWSNQGRLTVEEAAHLDRATWRTTLLPLFRELLAASMPRRQSLTQTPTVVPGG